MSAAVEKRRQHTASQPVYVGLCYFACYWPNKYGLLLVREINLFFKSEPRFLYLVIFLLFLVDFGVLNPNLMSARLALLELFRENPKIQDGRPPPSWEKR